ncbi:hypothetical protein QA601_14220 [Chitinispirillales bacterium ANBcel5]|uniref:hypothetical protein n=1 Tax=Cellulosispirillum alkaliphilum TaxID=3039283 RepID=UPI002A597712|nr:hypothetical protein [Chitinispirillales bacterium ANBcel5]
MLLYLFLFVGVFLVQNVSGQQQIDFQASFDGILDNREYNNSVTTDQTIFGGRLRTTLGFTRNQSYQLRVGASYFQELGASPDLNDPNLLLYYKFSGPHALFYMGSFPRDETLSYPLALFSDSTGYFRPNLQGAYFRVFNDYFTQDVWVDWVSRRTDDDPEHFLFGFSGSARYNQLFFDHHFKMFHMVGPAVRERGTGVIDNGGAMASIGYKQNGMRYIDTLMFSTGYLVTLDRLRRDGSSWNTPGGIIAQGKISAFNLGLKATAYKGEGNNQLFSDPFYEAPSYGRIDLSYGRTVADGTVDFRYTQGVHLIENGVDLSNMFLLTMRFNHTLFDSREK